MRGPILTVMADLFLMLFMLQTRMTQVEAPSPLIEKRPVVESKTVLQPRNASLKTLAVRVRSDGNYYLGGQSKRLEEIEEVISQYAVLKVLPDMDAPYVMVARLEALGEKHQLRIVEGGIK